MKPQTKMENLEQDLNVDLFKFRDSLNRVVKEEVFWELS
jgi:hypothetical protein